jgi:hypothetical protein
MILYLFVVYLTTLSVAQTVAHNIMIKMFMVNQQ